MAEDATQPDAATGRIDRRRQLARLKRDPKRQRVAFGIIGLLLLIVLGILIAGYIFIFVLPPRELVIRVGEVEYTRGDMVQLLRIKQRVSEYQGIEFNTSADIFEALNVIIENEIIAQEAPGMGITVSNEEVEAQIQSVLSPPQAGGKTEAQLQREFEERYNSYLNAIQVSRAEHQALVRRSILREKFRQYIGQSVPAVAPQVHLHRLVVTPNDEIDIMNTKYRDFVGIQGEPTTYSQAFHNITREFSRGNAEVIRKGGDLGWVPEGIFQDYDDVIFNLEPGELSDPVTNLEQPREMFVFMVSEQAEARELSDPNREQLKTRALQDWLNEKRQEYDVYAVFNSEIYSWMVEQLNISSSSTPTPQPNNPLQQFMGG